MAIATTKTAYGDLPNVSIKYLPFIEKASKVTGVPVSIIAFTIEHESKGNPRAWNPNNNENSRGLMQISENAARSAPLNMKEDDFDDLYDPETNIMAGAKIQAWIKKNLCNYLPSDVDPVVLWSCVTGGYNQGWGYYKWAIQSLTKDQKELTWDNIVNRVNNPTTTSKKPWYDSVLSYSKAIVGNIDPTSLRGAAVVAGVGVGTLALIAGTIFLVIKMKQGQA